MPLFSHLNDANNSGTQQCAIPSPTVAERLEVFLIDYIIDQVILTIKYIKTLAGNEAEKTKRLLVFLLPVILLSVGINFPRFFEVIRLQLGSVHQRPKNAGGT